MASRYQIQMNYHRALQQASRLEELAEKLSALANERMSDAMDQIRSAWSGENADAFQNKGARLREKIFRTAQELRSAASAVRKIADNTYRAEMRAIELAEKRTYGDGK